MLESVNGLLTVGNEVFDGLVNRLSGDAAVEEDEGDESE